MTVPRALLDCLPNFFLLGAMKSGTTTLYEGLRQHENVHFGLAKEPQFFCIDGLYCKGLEFYAQRFYRNACNMPARGDATPHYLCFSKVALRIAESLPDSHCRFIVIFRNPVDRAYSHYWNSVREGHEHLSFEEALEAENQGCPSSAVVTMAQLRSAYFSAGLYARQLRPYLDQFSLKRFCFFLHEDLRDDWAGSVQTMLRFLGLQTGRSVGEVGAQNPAARERSVVLRDFLNQPSVLKRSLGRLLPYGPKYWLVRRLQRLNRKPAAYPSMRMETRERLATAYREDLTALESIIERDLSTWTSPSKIGNG